MMEKFSLRDQSLCAVIGRMMLQIRKSSKVNGLDLATSDVSMTRVTSTSQGARKNSLLLLAERMWPLQSLKIAYVRIHWSANVWSLVITSHLLHPLSQLIKTCSRVGLQPIINLARQSILSSTIQISSLSFKQQLMKPTRLYPRQNRFVSL